MKNALALDGTHQSSRDPYWFGEFNRLTSQSSERWSDQHSVMVPVDAFFPAVIMLFPKEKMALGIVLWIVGQIERQRKAAV